GERPGSPGQGGGGVARGEEADRQRQEEDRRGREEAERDARRDALERALLQEDPAAARQEHGRDLEPAPAQRRERARVGAQRAQRDARDDQQRQRARHAQRAGAQRTDLGDDFVADHAGGRVAERRRQPRDEPESAAAARRARARRGVVEHRQLLGRRLELAFGLAADHEDDAADHERDRAELLPREPLAAEQRAQRRRPDRAERGQRSRRA